MPYENDYPSSQTCSYPTPSLDPMGGQATISPAWDAPVGTQAPSAAGGIDWNGKLLDTGNLGWGIDMLTYFAEKTDAPGGMPLNMLGALNTAVNYDPATTGTTALLERGAVTAMDTYIGNTPLGALDQALGGHGTGVLTGGTKAVFALADAAMSGNMDALEQASEHLRSGEHGILAQGVAEVGNFAGEKAAELIYGKGPDVHQRAPRNADEQATYDRLMRGRKSGEVVFFDE